MDNLGLFLIQQFFLGASAFALAAGEILEGPKKVLIGLAFSPVDRYLSSFLFCPMCIGFWVGVAMSFALPAPWAPNIFTKLFAFGFSTAISGTIFDRLLYKEG